MKRILSTCMLAVMALFMAFQASAYEWTDIVLGESYPIAGFAKFYGKYTATKSGTLYEESIAYANVYDEEYVDEDSSSSHLIQQRSWTGTYNPYTYSLQVEAGKTYYFVMDYPWQFDAWNFKLYATSVFDVEKVEPAEGGYISHIGVGDGRVYVTFSEPPASVNYARLGKAATFLPSNAFSKLCNVGITGKTVGIDIQSAMLDLYADGLQKGDELTLGISVKLSDGSTWPSNSDGYHKISFKAASKPVSMVNYQIPSTVYSYMVPGNEEGKLVLTFDGDLDPKTSASQIYFEYGNKESENENVYGEFPIPFTIDKNVLTLDFTGVSRRHAELLPLCSTKYSSITVRILGLKDTDGNYVNSNTQGTVGSFSYLIRYEELPVVNITQEIEPASGTSLKGVNTINWWFDNANSLSFDGVRFDYKNADGQDAFVVVPMADIKNNSLNASEMDLVITIPAEVKAGRNISVSLNNLASTDGVDHSVELSARYDSFCITEITPAAGTTLEKLSAGQVVKVKSNYDATHPDMYLTYELIDNNPADPDQAILLASYMMREDDGSHSCEMFFDMPLYLGHTYKFRVNYFENEEASHGMGGYEAIPAGYDEVVWVGSCEPFAFSTYQFEGITPANGTTIATADANQFTLTFDGMVNLPSDECFILMGMGMHQPFESLTPVEPTDGYSSTWVATVSKAFLSGVQDYLMLSFKAYDMEGKLVQGNEGEEDGSYFYFNYPVAFNVPEFTCEPSDGEVVKSLSQFTLSFATGIYPSWIATEKIQLVNKTDVIHTFDDESFEYVDVTNEDTHEVTTVSVILTLPETITAEGEYRLMVPERYFNLGSESTARFSKAQSFTYTIEASEVPPVEPSAITFDPPYTETQSHLEYIHMVWDNEDEIGLGEGKATLQKPDGTVVVLPDAELDWDMYNKAIQHLGDKHQENGQYVVTFPERYFVLGAEGNRYEKEIKATYTVASSSSIEEVISSVDGLFTVYNMNGVMLLNNASIEEVKLLPTGVYVINGEKVIIR